MGPPGMTCSSRNTITLMSHSSGTACSRRRSTYAAIRPPLAHRPVLRVPTQVVPDVSHPAHRPAALGTDVVPRIQIDVRPVFDAPTHRPALRSLPHSEVRPA